jgi:hypothetical protein
MKTRFISALSGAMVIGTLCLFASKAKAQEDFQTDGESSGLTIAWGCEYTGNTSDVCNYTSGSTTYHVTRCKSTIPSWSNCGF